MLALILCKSFDLDNAVMFLLIYFYSHLIFIVDLL